MNVVELRLPPDEFALGELFSSDPDVRIELERIVPIGGRSIPFFWVIDDDVTFLTDVPTEDSSIEAIEIIGETKNGTLCRALWSADSTGIFQILEEQTATLLAADGTSDGWEFRVRFPDHEATTRFRKACDETAITYEVLRIHSLDEFSSRRYDLTDEQYEALVAALDAGYFRVPRKTSLSELADELDISPQAASGRLRRGLERILETTFLPDASVESR